MFAMPAELPQGVLSIATFIQLSVAPVFLLTGVGAMLGVLTNRLSRIIDRARQLEVRYETADAFELWARLHQDLRLLSQRARLVSWSISLCTTCSLFVCTIITALFLEALLDTHFRGVVPVLFILAMVAFIFGLLLFLREIYLATAALRIGPGEEESL
ncbi:MAG: DUF2721 domain-containing protein [Moraxellaceae bacterium]